MIIEHRTFRLAAGIDEDELLEADREVQTEVAPFQRGFIRRTTARHDDGRWLVETLWSDAACASAAERSDTGDALAALVDPATDVTERWATLD